MAEDVFRIAGTTQAGMFDVETVVAEGGFGVVYRAHHQGFRAPVALKCLRIPDGMTEMERAAFLEKFRDEGEILFHLSASIPEVVRPLHIDVLTLGDGRVVPFLALEWLAGESLEATLTRRREQGQGLGVHKAVKLLRPIAHALAKAHRFEGGSIVHRDVKPQNIFVVTKGGVESVKILDFGIAKARWLASEVTGFNRRDEDIDSVATSNPFTPAYAAPEQWMPRRYGAPGPWTDVWGLALTMVEAITGGPALDGEPLAIRTHALDTARRPTPRANGAVVSDEVETAFKHALAVDPKQRTRTIEAFWTELERGLGVPVSFGTRDLRRDSDEVPAITRPSGPTSGAERVRFPGNVRTMEAPTTAIVPIVAPPVLPDLELPTGSSRSANDSGRYAIVKVRPKREMHETDLEADSFDEVSIPIHLDIGTTQPSAGSRQGAAPQPIAPIVVREPPPSPAVESPAPAGASDAPVSPAPIVSLSPASPHSTAVASSQPPSSIEVAVSVDPRPARIYEERPAPTLQQRLRVPGFLLAAAIALTSLEILFARIADGPLPVRLVWIAAPLALAGAGLLLRELLGASNG